MKASIVIIFLCILLSALPANAQVTNTELKLPLLLTQNLSQGFKSGDVSLLQQFLQKYSYFTYPTITGYFGLVTKQAVVDFQTVNNIDPIGIVGPITRAKIAEFIQLVKIKSGGAHQRRVVDNEEEEEPDPEEPVDIEAPLVSFDTDDFGDSIFNLSDDPIIGITVSDNVGVVGAQFYVNDESLGTEQTGPTFEVMLDTSEYSHGLHDLIAVVRDAAGNQATTTASFSIDTSAPQIEFSNPRSQVVEGDTLRMSTQFTYLDFEEVEDSIVYVYKVYRQGSEETPIFEGTGSSVYDIVTTTEGTPYVFEVYVIGMSGNHSNLITYTVTVVPPEDYAFMVTKDGTGDGAIDINPNDYPQCNVDCQNSFPVNTVVTLNAYPSLGSSFMGWSGGGCSGTGSCVITITEYYLITATFNLDE